MMQLLLADRYKLRVHRDEHEVRTTYELVLAKGGSKMKEDNPSSDKDEGAMAGGRAAFDGLVDIGGKDQWACNANLDTGGSFARPVGFIRRFVDETGLTGRYDVVF